MTSEQFRALNICVEAENLFGEAPSNCVFEPLAGVAKELVDLGYLFAHQPDAGIIGLSVTRAGRLAVMQ